MDMHTTVAQARSPRSDGQSLHGSSTLPDEAEINSMGVAELRQAMLGFVRMHKTAATPSIHDSAVAIHDSAVSIHDSAVAIHARSPPSPFASLAATDSLQARRRHRTNSDASASHRMGIDLLLNASTISDRMDGCQLPSPPTHAKRSLSPAPLSSPPTEDGWHGGRRQALPPIAQLAGLHGASPPPLQESGSTSSSCTSLASAAHGPLSAPDAAFRAGDTPSLQGYKLGVAHAHSFPPRQHLGAGHPSPPASQHSSPMGAVPAQAAPIPAAAYALPPAGDTVAFPDLRRARSPPARARQFHPYHQPHMPPQLMPPQLMPPQLMPPQPMPPQPRHVAGVPLAVMRSARPKFNYAFMDTKRPRGPSSRWTPREDDLLKRAVKQFGEDRQWVKVAGQVPGRTNLQCRQRWLCNIKLQVEKERQAKQ
ncbi:myb-like DNA-binding protein bas1 [Coemansia sp. RSA 2610]|nr:myb-like DNA-binding protein bas1 [Coemansia sp. RSA 2610]